MLSSINGTLEKLKRDQGLRHETPRVDLIQANKLAVKTGGLLNGMMNSTVTNSLNQQAEKNLKMNPDTVSDSMANSMTNFSKNKDTDSYIAASHLP
mmetsp:Transcript_14153/g.22062  ORF Transcript_14153/g.22062 Transcript_14153/m.22062 type:complete len:96 (+) Transcript_14153:776-1063(+)